MPQILGGWIGLDRRRRAGKLCFFLFGLSVVVTELKNDFLRRWIWKIGRLQDLKTVENVAKLKKGRLTELGECDCGQDGLGKKSWRLGHVVRGRGTETRVPDVTRNCGA